MTLRVSTKNTLIAGSFVIAAAIVTAVFGYPAGYRAGSAAIEQSTCPEVQPQSTNSRNTEPTGDGASDGVPNVESTPTCPVNLSTLVVIDSQHYDFQDALIVDSFGNQYVQAYTFHGSTSLNTPYHVQSYAIFNLGNKYDSFEADIVAPQGIPSDAKFTLDIILDDSTTPAKAIDGYSVATGLVHIAIPVSGVTKMRITADNTAALLGSEGAIILVNAILSCTQ